MKEHASGCGANLIKHAMNAGIGFSIAAVWLNASHVEEYALKNQKNTPQFCPMCHPVNTRSMFPQLTMVTDHTLTRSGIELHYPANGVTNK